MSVEKHLPKLMNVIEDPFACSQITFTKLAKNNAANGLIKNIGPDLSRQYHTFLVARGG